MMFGDVPTRVTSPPRSEAKDIGMSRLEGEVLVRRAVCRAMGISMARAPTFLVAIDRIAVATTNTGTWLLAVFRRGVIGRRTASITPDRAKPALTTRAQAMIRTTSLEKPSKAFFAGVRPSSTEA